VIFAAITSAIYVAVGWGILIGVSDNQSNRWWVWLLFATLWPFLLIIVFIAASLAMIGEWAEKAKRGEL